MKKIYFYFLFTFISILLSAQHTEWIRSYDDVHTGLQTSVTCDEDTNVISVARVYQKQNLFGYVINPNNIQSSNLVITKFTNDNKLIWLYQTNALPSYYSDISPLDIITDMDNNIYVLANLNGKYDFGNGILISSDTLKQELIIFKISKNGQILWVREIKNNINYYNYASFDISENHIYIDFLNTTNDTLVIPSNNDTIPVKNSKIIFCLDTNATFKFHYQIDSVTSNFIVYSKIKTNKTNKNEIFFNLKANIDNQTNRIKVNNNQYLNNKSDYILKMDTLGNFTIIEEIQNYFNDSLSSSSLYPIPFSYDIDFSTSPYSYYISHLMSDSLIINNETLKPNIKFPDYHNCIIKKQNNKTIWFKYNTSDSTVNSHLGVDNILVDKDNIYTYGNLNYSNSFFDGNMMDSHNGCGFFLMKIDTSGEFKWYNSQSYCSISHNDARYKKVATDKNNDLYVAGGYRYTFSFFGDSVTSNNSLNFVGMIAKVADYTITRDSIYLLRYCAGDSIKIPYLKKGNYKSDNFFIAELSDEEGKFDGKERELGRIKSRYNDTIRGLIPSSQIITSNKYRIRIKSTHPELVNLYEIDSLRLTIFSKDKANAGADQTICKGDSIELSTTGGSQWQWSPGNFTRDSSISKTWAYPDSTTNFRIIIRDSSGCGNNDTDYVKITVRAPLDIQAPFYDTVVTKGDSVVFYANTFGGLVKQHYVKWYQKINNQLEMLDSGMKSIKVGSDTGKIIYAILWDSCSSERDTQIYYLNILQKLKVAIVSNVSNNVDVNDTFVCVGNSIKLFAKGSGGIASGYSYSWFHQNNTLIGTGNSITVSPDSSQNYYVVFSNNNTLKPDTNYVFIKVYKKLETEIYIQNINTGKLYIMPNDTTICFGNSLTLIAKIKGGDSTKYKYDWKIDAKKYTANDTLNIKFPSNSSNGGNTESLVLISQDQCIINADTTEKTIHILPKTKLNLTLKDTVCIGASEMFTAQTIGGDSLNYQYEWKVDGTIFSKNDSMIFPPNNAIGKTIGNHQLTVAVKDACTSPYDSIVKNIFIADTLRLTTIISDTFCAGNIIDITATAKGGLTKNYQYEWYWNGNLISQTHNFSYQTTQSDEGKINILNVKLKDNCSVINVDFNKSVFVNFGLKTNIEIDSNCVDNKVKITAKSEGGKTSKYEFEWYVNDELKEKNKTGILLFASDESKQIKAVLNDGGCSFKEDSSEIILPAFIPKISVELTPKVGCVPSEIQLKITNENTTQNTYTWHTGNGNDTTSNAENYSNLYDKVGFFQSDIDVVTSQNCTLKISQGLIKIFPLPTADFEWNPSIVSLMNPQVYFENKSLDGNFFQWFINDSLFSNDANPNYLFYDTGLYKITLIAQTKNTCTDTLEKLLYMNDHANYYIPTAFTPNGDGLNDVFLPITAGIKSYEIQIYNRWGTLIFEGDMQHHWDGRFNNTPLTDGSYAYVMRLVRMDTSVIYTKGILHLIR